MPQKCGDLHKPEFGKASTFVCWDSEHGGKAGGEEAVGGRVYGLEQARHDDRAGGVRGSTGEYRIWSCTVCSFSVSWLLAL